VVAAGIVGGRVAAVITAVAGAVAYDLAFIPPVGTFRVTFSDDIVALVVFGLVAVAVGTLVASVADQRRAAERQADEIRAMQAEQERLREEANRLAVLERVDEQRAALLRSVSHDLRSPLAAIRAVASDLRSGMDLTDPVRNELLDVVCDEAERLDRIVANLLSLSRIEAGALQPDRQAVVVEELCTAVAARLARLFTDVKLEVNVPDDLPLVDADYVQVDQVLTNLLENAARHSAAGETVRVGAVESGGFVDVSVIDEGPGIDPNERDHLFEPFRAGSGSTSTGVGLAICKAIVEAHGGHISAENGPDGGARFTFTLPVRHG
jgi:two-component system sensor histidine kinase KdpD